MRQVTKFDSVEDLIKQATSPCQLDDKHRASLVGSEQFTRTKSLNEAVDLARRGWDGGTSFIERLRANIEKELSGQIPVIEPEWDVVGDVIDMGRHVTGEPEDMITLEDHGLRRHSYAPSILRVVFNLSASAAVSAETMLRRGAAMVVLVDTLERHRLRCQVELVGVASTRAEKPGHRLEYRVIAKRDSEHVSLDKLAYLLGHASSWRRLFLSLMEHEPNDVRKRFGIGRDTRGGYGFPGTTPDKGDIFLDRIFTDTDWSEGFTMAWLRSNLQAQGIALEEV